LRKEQRCTYFANQVNRFQAMIAQHFIACPSQSEFTGVRLDTSRNNQNSTWK